MAITERLMACTPQQVFDVLLDAYLYKHWVVGAKDIRGADPHWPAIGATFYHRLGTAQAHLKDKSEILDLEVPHRIELRIYARPLGIGRVIITARPTDDGTIVSIKEDPEIGTKLRPLGPLINPLTHIRNLESLRRLEKVISIRRVSQPAVTAGVSG